MNLLTLGILADVIDRIVAPMVGDIVRIGFTGADHQTIQVGEKREQFLEHQFMDFPRKRLFKRNSSRLIADFLFIQLN